MTDPALYLLEPPDPGSEWEPFRSVRPIAELRAGAWRVRERWAMLLGREVTAVLSGHCPDFADAGAAPCRAPAPVDGPAIVAASWFAPIGAGLELPADVRRLTAGGESVGWIVPAGERWPGDDLDGGPAFAVEGLHLRGTCDLLTALEHLLADDCATFLAESSDGVPPGSIMLGPPGLVASFGAVVEPGVVFDTRTGAIILSSGCIVRSGTRLEGPIFAAPDTWLLGGAVRHSSFGPATRVHGEVSNSVFLGFANKSHDGFLGHSVLGQWVNLGAGTITSNLKNTYGEVSLDLPGGRLATGRTNVGTLFGDHVKTGIGTLLSTGTVVGAGASVVGGPVPRYVVPFAWGSGERLQLEGFLKIAGRVMPRRHVDLTPAITASLIATHQRLAR
ncbi:MAG: putative sugar nucleotidyl transferase [Gemmatimonadota bacterium]